MDVTRTTPLMLLLVFREERAKGAWRLRDRADSKFRNRYTQIDLEPLTETQSAELLEKLLPGARFAPETWAEIWEKSKGNPFYLEEVVRSLIDSEAVVPEEIGSVDALVAQYKPEAHPRWRVTDKIAEINVPNTLQSAIGARIDRLASDAQLALEMAAVIGSKFHSDVLEVLAATEAEISADIDLQISRLEESDLIEPSGTSLLSYRFSDVLVQEVAYEKLLTQRRQEFHRIVGEVLERRLAENKLKVELEAMAALTDEQIDELKMEDCGPLAYHFGRSDSTDKALIYLPMAAKKARGEYDLKSAIEYYKRLSEIKGQLGDRKGQAGALYQMGVMAYEIGDYEPARRWLEASVSLLDKLGDIANKAWSVMYLGMINLKQGKYAEATEYHQDALTLSQELENTKILGGIHLTNLARVQLRMGAYEDALTNFTESLASKEQRNDKLGLGFSYYYMGLAYLYQGDLEYAEDAIGKATAFWEEIKNKRGIAYARQGQGLLALEREQFTEAEALFQEAHDICDELVLKAEIVENLSYLGQAHLGQSDVNTAFNFSYQAMDLLETQKDVEAEQQFYWNHFCILDVRQDRAASEFLQKAYDTLMEQADPKQIGSLEARDTFLTNVPVNRQILDKVTSDEWVGHIEVQADYKV